MQQNSVAAGSQARQRSPEPGRFVQYGLLQAENEPQSPEIKLLKEKIDLRIRRLFDSKSEMLDAAELELNMSGIGGFF